MKRITAGLLALLACTPPESEEVTSVTFGGGLCPYGACHAELTLDGDAVTYDGLDVNGDPWSNSGTLTADGAAALADAEASVAGVPLDETYGCPGCDDGAAITVTLRADDGETRSTTYEGGDPPPELAELDAVLMDIAAALTTCVASDLVELDPGCAVP